MRKQLLDTDQIMYALGDGNYSNLYFSNGTVELTSHTLKWYEEGYPTFLRISKSAMINPKYIKDCVSVSPGIAYITMDTGVQIAISRRRIQRVAFKLRRMGESVSKEVGKPGRN
ncbi:LytTR family transcriptional regulator [Spirosoma sp. KCTC 42546]|uniref:LytR/AlgR family response regulator transcription factor n=1 Tax=Spirosoma sp. KCTC 42546 TaxID=2520506 RepID=UPI00115C1D32|nr:LytTR family DNA-binding domain-containing protein [Spirosoma sp. KCTC 42546]QDK77516.1 LytTR family transcriptional regulator [Spirosoma sp. KCTC 42546]